MVADVEKAGAAREDSTSYTNPVSSSRLGDSDTDSHNHEKNSDEDKSRHSDRIEEEEGDDDDEEEGSHHDPEPEGPEGLNTGVPPSRTQSRASSSRPRVPVVVPASKRRGLFGRFSVIPEVERPYDYSRKTKWIITTVVALAAAGAPLGSNLFYPALPTMAVEFRTTETITNLTVALYMLSMSIFPLWWSAFSETLGRRTIYLVSFTLFVVFSILSAVSTSISMLIVMRVLGGGAAASVQSVGAGTIADMWEPFERGTAMGMFYLGPLTGPLFAPIIGGALTQAWGWQSTMWFLTIFGGLNLIMIFFCLPETLSKRKQTLAQQEANGQVVTRIDSLARMSTTQSVKVKTKRGAAMLKKALIEPLGCILYLRFPPVTITVIYAAVTFGSLFVLNVSIQSSFSLPPYSFKVLIVGLLYIPGSLGYFLSSFTGGKWVDYIMKREAVKAGRYDAHGKLIFLPEDRMRENAWLAATMYPGAMIWFGWTVNFGIFWLVPCVANFFFGFASMLVFGAATTMLTEFMPKKSSSGVALNNFVRNIFSCVGVVVTQPLLDAMGVGWLCTMIALVAWLVSNLCIFLLLRYASRWRAEMDVKMQAMK